MEDASADAGFNEGSDSRDARTALAPTRGRGAASRVAGRFEKRLVHGEDDGWGSVYADAFDDDGEPLAPPRTQVTEERARSIISRNQSPDIGFSQSINPYRGCEHGCVYCFARPSHAYLDLSPGLDFETRLYAKTNAVERLRHELSRPGYVPSPIALGINTDAYHPIERRYGLTRALLEVLAETKHPVHFVTKGGLVERDIDLLAPMAEQRLACAAVTLTTLDPRIARTLEPRAAAPERRLRTIRTLSEAGIPVSVSVAPIIPFVTEPEIERILEAAFNAGATGAHYVVLRLPHEVNPLFQEWLQAHFPDRAQRVMNRIRDMRGGKDYDSDFSKRMAGEGVWADLIRQRFYKTVERLGMTELRGRFGRIDTSQFRRPLSVPPTPGKQNGNATGQLDLF